MLIKLFSLNYDIPVDLKFKVNDDLIKAVATGFY